MNSSLQGLTTIRAFGVQQMLKHNFDTYQDIHSSAWFMFLGSSRTFGFWLDLICVFYIASVTLHFLLIGTGELIIEGKQCEMITKNMQFSKVVWNEMKKSNKMLIPFYLMLIT